MFKKTISVFCVLQLAYNIVCGQRSDYPATTKTKELIAAIKCNRVKLPIIDTTIVLCNTKTDTLIGKANLNGKLINYKMLFVGNMGTGEMTITDISNNNTGKIISYIIKGSPRQYCLEKTLICDVYGNCKPIKIKIFTPVVTKKIGQR